MVDGPVSIDPTILGLATLSELLSRTNVDNSLNGHLIVNDEAAMPNDVVGKSFFEVADSLAGISNLVVRDISDTNKSINAGKIFCGSLTFENCELNGVGISNSISATVFSFSTGTYNSITGWNVQTIPVTDRADSGLMFRNIDVKTLALGNAYSDMVSIRDVDIAHNLLLNHVDCKHIALVGSTELGGVNIQGIDPDSVYIDFKRVRMNQYPTNYTLQATLLPAFEAIKRI